jgi:hypothetical protein
VLQLVREGMKITDTTLGEKLGVHRNRIGEYRRRYPVEWQAIKKAASEGEA